MGQGSSPHRQNTGRVIPIRPSRASRRTRTARIEQHLFQAHAILDAFMAGTVTPADAIEQASRAINRAYREQCRQVSR